MIIMLMEVWAQCFLMSGGIKDPCLMILMKWKIFLESSLVWEDPQEDQGSDTEPHRATHGPGLPIRLPPSITGNHTPTSLIGDIRIQKNSEHFKLNPFNILIFEKTLKHRPCDQGEEIRGRFNIFFKHSALR